MSRFNVLLSGYSIIDEVLNRDGPTAAPIGHDYIVGDGYEIWAGVGKTGTKLVLNTDYTLNNKNDYYSAADKANTDIFTKVAIINGAYQNMNLYQTYTTLGDALSIENVREVVIGNTAIVTGNYTIPESVGRVLVNTADAVTLTISADHPQYKKLEIGRLVASTNAVTLARSGSETINGATTFVIHGAEESSVLNPQINTITKQGVSAWVFTDGIIKGSNAYGTYQKFPDRTLRMRTPAINLTVGTNANVSINFPHASAVDWFGGCNVFASFTGSSGYTTAWYLTNGTPGTTDVNITYTVIGGVPRVCLWIDTKW